ncbi:putative cytosolic iron-sulfur protein assembly protein 1 [Myxozyma melibiosi]|uniref:Probable cytosolic iron-sulfur protein assembly protein 1 n=1 Tax=Myxozyma melibiosi TaxID=54550 RepID=A0ABR1F1V4_9ASCO
MPIRQVHSIPAHADRIWSVAPHPTLPLLACATSEKSAQIYSLNTYFPVANLDGNHKRSIRSVAWRPESTDEPTSEIVLATASFDGTVGIWVRDDERYAQEEWEFVASLEGHENEVKCVNWSSDGRYIASCSRDKSVWVWEALDGIEEIECMAVLQDHTQDVKHVVWHSLEELIASASYDDTIRLWREDDGEFVCSSELTGHRSTVWCVDFETPRRADSNDDEDETMNRRLVSCSADETVRVWRRTGITGALTGRYMPSTLRNDPVSETWQQEAILPSRHSGPIYSVSWSARSGRIVSAGADGLLVVYQETKPGEWEVIAEEEDAHSVFEINTCVWKEEIIITGGDDGNINIWQVTA